MTAADTVAWEDDGAARRVPLGREIDIGTIVLFGLDVCH